MNTMKLMATIATIACIVLSIGIGHAQTWDEWFEQKKTQKKYLVQQIAALKVYVSCLKEGYDIAKKGLNIVGDIKQGKFDMDIEYLESLRNVNPAISGSAKVASIVAYQRLVMLEFRTISIRANESDLLTKEEEDHIADVYANMLRESQETLEELDRLLSSSDFEMKDDERIKRLDLLFADIQDKYVFARSFSNSTQLLIGQREKELSEIHNHYKLLDL